MRAWAYALGSGTTGGNPLVSFGTPADTAIATWRTNAATTLQGNNAYITAAGFVGIGTAAPNRLLHLSGSSGAVGVQIVNTSIEANGFLIYHGGAGVNSLQIYEETAAKGWMQIQGTSGFIGIGGDALSPVVNLHIDRNSDAYVKFSVSGTTGSGVGDGFNVGVTSAGVAQLIQYENQPLNIFTNNTLALTVSAAGVLTFQVSGNESTGAGSAALGANCPAVTASAPYKWLKVILSDASVGFVPVWK